MRDGVSHCEYLNSDEICKLLFSICTDTFQICSRNRQQLGVHGPSHLMLLTGLLYLCIAESVPQVHVHPIQSQHLNCGIVYQQTSETQDH